MNRNKGRTVTPIEDEEDQEGAFERECAEAGFRTGTVQTEAGESRPGVACERQSKAVKLIRATTVPLAFEKKGKEWVVYLA